MQLQRTASLVFVGYGIVAPEYRVERLRADLDVRGKTVVVLLNDPGYATRDPKTISKAEMPRPITAAGIVQDRRRPQRQGAAGVLLVHDTAPRPVTAGTWWSKHTGAGPQLQLVPRRTIRLPAVGARRLDFAAQAAQSLLAAGRVRT